jgi:putative transcriptional regulator
MVQHTPPEELLFDYAAGTLPEPLAVLVASHLTLSPESRRDVNEAEALGGALLDELEPAVLSDEALDAMMARLENAGTKDAPDTNGQAGPTPPPTAGQGDNDRRVPGVLKDYIGGRDFNALQWRERSGNVAEYGLLSDYPGFKTRLLRIKAGARVPSHTHGGREFTLVLQGGFSDGFGHYLPGDVSVADPNVTHQPVADEDEDCICLAVTDAPLKMTGAVGRVLNFFVDI